MRIVHLLLLVCLVALTAGCLISEQIGEPVGHGNHRMPGDDVAFHFDTDFNRILMFGRSALLIVVAVWIFKSWGAQAGSVLVGGGLLVAAGWLGLKDYPSLSDYYLDVAPEGLTLRVPPDMDVQIPWQSVEALELEGRPYSRIAGNVQYNPFGTSVQLAGVELPDWAMMKITISGGESYTINMKALSIEHRQIFAKALIKRAGLVQMD